MNQAEREVMENLCREFALFLRRLTGRDIKIMPGELPVEITLDDQALPDQEKTIEVKNAAN